MSTSRSKGIPLSSGGVIRFSNAYSSNEISKNNITNDGSISPYLSKGYGQINNQNKKQNLSQNNSTAIKNIQMQQQQQQTIEQSQRVVQNQKQTTPMMNINNNKSSKSSSSNSNSLYQQNKQYQQPYCHRRNQTSSLEGVSQDKQQLLDYLNNVIKFKFIKTSKKEQQSSQQQQQNIYALQSPNNFTSQLIQQGQQQHIQQQQLQEKEVKQCASRVVKEYQSQSQTEFFYQCNNHNKQSNQMSNQSENVPSSHSNLNQNQGVNQTIKGLIQKVVKEKQQKQQQFLQQQNKNKSSHLKHQDLVVQLPTNNIIQQEQQRDTDQFKQQIAATPNNVTLKQSKRCDKSEQNNNAIQHNKVISKQRNKSEQMCDRQLKCYQKEHNSLMQISTGGKYFTLDSHSIHNSIPQDSITPPRKATSAKHASQNSTLTFNTPCFLPNNQEHHQNSNEDTQYDFKNLIPSSKSKENKYKLSCRTSQLFNTISSQEIKPMQDTQHDLSSQSMIEDDQNDIQSSLSLTHLNPNKSQFNKVFYLPPLVKSQQQQQQQQTTQDSSGSSTHYYNNIDIQEDSPQRCKIIQSKTVSNPSTFSHCERQITPSTCDGKYIPTSSSPLVSNFIVSSSPKTVLHSPKPFLAEEDYDIKKNLKQQFNLESQKGYLKTDTTPPMTERVNRYNDTTQKEVHSKLYQEKKKDRYYQEDEDTNYNQDTINQDELVLSENQRHMQKQQHDRLEVIQQKMESMSLQYLQLEKQNEELSKQVLSLSQQRDSISLQNNIYRNKIQQLMQININQQNTINNLLRRMEKKQNFQYDSYSFNSHHQHYKVDALVQQQNNNKLKASSQVSHQNQQNIYKDSVLPSNQPPIPLTFQGYLSQKNSANLGISSDSNKQQKNDYYLSTRHGHQAVYNN